MERGSTCAFPVKECVRSKMMATLRSICYGRLELLESGLPNAFRREGVVVYIGLCNTIIAHKSYANNTLHHISNIEVFIIATIIFNYFIAQ